MKYHTTAINIRVDNSNCFIIPFLSNPWLLFPPPLDFRDIACNPEAWSQNIIIFDGWSPVAFILANMGHDEGEIYLDSSFQLHYPEGNEEGWQANGHEKHWTLHINGLIHDSGCNLPYRSYTSRWTSWWTAWSFPSLLGQLPASASIDYGHHWLCLHTPLHRVIFRQLHCHLGFCWYPVPQKKPKQHVHSEFGRFWSYDDDWTVSARIFQHLHLFILGIWTNVV